MFKWLVRYAERQRQAVDAHPAAPNAEPAQSATDGPAADSAPQEAQQPAGAASSWPVPAEQSPAVGCTLQSHHATHLHRHPSEAGESSQHSASKVTAVYAGGRGVADDGHGGHPHMPRAKWPPAQPRRAGADRVRMLVESVGTHPTQSRGPSMSMSRLLAGIMTDDPSRITFRNPGCWRQASAWASRARCGCGLWATWFCPWSRTSMPCWQRGRATSPRPAKPCAWPSPPSTRYVGSIYGRTPWLRSVLVCDV